MKIHKPVIEKVAECLKHLGFSVHAPRSEDPNYAIATTFQIRGVEMRFEITHDRKENMLVFIGYFPERVPKECECDIFAVLNAINAESPLGHFAFPETTNEVTFRFAYFLLDEEFNKVKFKENFRKLLLDARENYPLLQKLITTEGANT